MNGVNRHPMHSSKRFDVLATIFFNGGGNRSDEAGSPDRFLWIEMALVFSALNFFQDGINSYLLYLYRLWLGRRLSHTRVMLSGRRGCSDWRSPDWPAGDQLTVKKKPSSQHLTHIRPRIFFV